MDSSPFESNPSLFSASNEAMETPDSDDTVLVSDVSLSPPELFTCRVSLKILGLLFCAYWFLKYWSKLLVSLVWPKS